MWGNTLNKEMVIYVERVCKHRMKAMPGNASKKEPMTSHKIKHKHILLYVGQRIDKSLRRLLTHVRVPGEAQKIERIMEEFGRHYYSCNSKKSYINIGQTNCGMDVSRLTSPDSIVTLAFAIMMLNTDLHTPNIKGMLDGKMEGVELKVIMLIRTHLYKLIIFT